MIEKITRLPLREIWKDEARDLTTWLQENIDALNDVLDFEIVNLDREQSTGNFHVDLIGEDNSGNTVIIENQLEKSNHDHLGKVVTYLSSFEARKAIWIVSEARPEHVNAVTWLNEAKNTEFYFLKLEAIKIGFSNPAPLFTLIVGPSEAIKEAGTTKKNISELHRRRHKFWSSLLERSRALNHLLFNANSPTEYNWIGATSGLRGVNYSYWLNKDTLQIKIYIDRGKGSEEANLKIFHEIKAHQKEIEQEFGSPLEWRELEQYRACIISKELTTGGWGSEEKDWPKIQKEAIEAMILLEKSTKKIITSLRI